DGDDEHARVGDIDLGENLRPRAVAEDDRLARLRGRPRDRRIHVEDTIANADFLKHARQILSIETVADDDHVTAVGGSTARFRLARRAARFLRRERHTVAPLHQKRRRHKAQDRRGEECLVAGFRKEAVLPTRLFQNERELAYLRQTQPDDQAEPQRAVKRSEDQHDNTGLDGDEQCEDAQLPGDVGAHERDIEQHADGKKEDAAEAVAQRQQIRDHLMAVFRFRQQQSRDKSAERERDAELIGEECRREGNEQNEKREKLAASEQRDLVEQPRQSVARRAHDHGDREQRLGERTEQDHGGDRRRRAEGGDQQRHRNERQILHHEHAGRDPAVQRVGLAAIGKDSEDDGGAAVDDEKTVENRYRDRQAEGGDDRGHDSKREKDLQQPRPRGIAAHRGELGERHVESDGKQQDDNADVRDRRHRRHVAHELEPVRADHHAREEKADNGGKSDTLEQKENRERDREDD